MWGAHDDNINAQSFNNDKSNNIAVIRRLWYIINIKSTPTWTIIDTWWNIRCFMRIRISRPSYLHNGISFTGKTTSLYWIRARIAPTPWLPWPVYVSVHNPVPTMDLAVFLMVGTLWDCHILFVNALLTIIFHMFESWYGVEWFVDQSSITHISMAERNTAVTPECQQRRYCNLALSHR